MKKLEEIKNEVAKKHGNSSWVTFLTFSKNDIPKIIQLENEVAEEYARKCCEEQIKACAEKAKIGLRCKLGSSPKTVVSKTSILNTPNVALTKTDK